MPPRLPCGLIPLYSYTQNLDNDPRLAEASEQPAIQALIAQDTVGAALTPTGRHTCCAIGKRSGPYFHKTSKVKVYQTLTLSVVALPGRSQFLPFIPERERSAARPRLR